MNIEINKSINKNIIIINKDIIKIYDKDVENKQHNNVIAPAEIIFPIKIERKDHLMFKLENPAIKLPDHTPVNGNGMATKPVNKRYFLKFDSCLFISWLF